jgi:hypothetical protein
MAESRPTDFAISEGNPGSASVVPREQRRKRRRFIRVDFLGVEQTDQLGFCIQGRLRL